MRNLFLPGTDLSQDSICIEGPDAHHLLNGLRIRPGETLTLLDNKGGACLAEVSDLGKRSVTVSVMGPVVCPPAPAGHVTVAQALGKGDKFDQVIQHATEVGASAFIPLITERTVVKLDARNAESKRGRWSQIAKGAAEQSGRARIPEIHPAVSLSELCPRFGEFASVLLLHPPPEEKGKGEEGTKGVRAGAISPLPLFPSSLLVLVGPEGGFSPGELEMAEAAGAVRTALGPFTLRTETAALVAVSRILYEAERG